MNIRKCDCVGTHGITYKGFTISKIFQCDEHGLICPFDGWQFKTPLELYNHIESGEETIRCEGKFRFGDNVIQESLFELKVVMDEKIKPNTKRC